MSARAPRIQRWLRTAGPFVVSALLLGYLIQRVDLAAVWQALDWRIGLLWTGAIAVFSVFSLAVESHCLHRVTASRGVVLARVEAARIKAACYLLSVLNYALGAAGLSILMRRRTGLGVTEAAGVVLLIAFFDVAMVIVLGAGGAALLGADSLAVRLGLLAGIVGAALTGLGVLRHPGRLGPIDRLRDWALFRAPREAPVALLFELAALRLVFVLGFVVLNQALFTAFGIETEWLRLTMNVAIMLAVSALPIAAGGIGASQLVFVELFEGWAPEAELLAASLVFSFGIIVSRAALGWLFAGEFAREALAVVRDEQRGGDAETPGESPPPR